jgi:hypothetical protein
MDLSRSLTETGPLSGELRRCKWGAQQLCGSRLRPKTPPQPTTRHSLTSAFSFPYSAFQSRNYAGSIPKPAAHFALCVHCALTCTYYSHFTGCPLERVEGQLICRAASKAVALRQGGGLRIVGAQARTDVISLSMPAPLPVRGVASDPSDRSSRLFEMRSLTGLRGIVASMV